MKLNWVKYWMFGFVLLAISCSQTQNIKPNAENTVNAVKEIVLKNVKYGEYDRNFMDIYLPENRTPNSAFVINIHGGAWTGGDKHFDDELAAYLFSNGIGVANVNYRYADLEGTHLPELLDDIAEIANYLKKNASEWSIRKEGFSISGASSGAHVSLMYAYTRDSEIKAIVERCGPVDFTDTATLEYIKQSNLFEVIDKMSGNKVQWKKGDSVPELYVNTSPVKFVKPIPTMIIHGNMDDVVPIQQAFTLENELKQINAKYELVVLEGTTHHLEKRQEDKEKVFAKTLEWLKKYGTN